MDSVATNSQANANRRRPVSDGTASFVGDRGVKVVKGASRKLIKMVSAKTRMKAPKQSKFMQDFLALVEGRNAGHMGKWEYANGGMKLWDKFLQENPDYYIPREDRALIERCASASAELLKLQDVKKVTLVSRGPGTQFDAKEGALIRAFQVAGIEIAKVVYIDVSKPALNQSVKEGKALLPNAEHEAVQADMFDPETAKEYRVIGTEVGTCFGLTPMNAQGRHDGIAPTTAIEENLSGIRKQMRKGAHFIATYDHNSDPDSIQAAYAGQAEFAKHMLDHHLGWDSSDGVDFITEYNKNSFTLAHGFQFSKKKSFEVVTGRCREIAKGVTVWFNNSVKLPLGMTKECHENVGLAYPAEPIVSNNNRLGYHHTMAA